MTHPSGETGTYTLQDAEDDIALLQAQIAAGSAQEASSIVSPLILGYATSTARGPYTDVFTGGVVSDWTGTNCTLTGSTVSVTGWPTGGSGFSMLLTASGAGNPSSLGPFFKCSPNDPVFLQFDVYCPAALSHVFVGLQFFDEAFNLLSENDCPDTPFSTGQIQTLSIGATSPLDTGWYAVIVGDHHADPVNTLIYAGNVIAAGNLTIAIATSAGTDSVGNPYVAGVSVINPLTGQASLVEASVVELDQLSVENGPVLVYGNGTVVQNLSGSGNWTAPAGVHSVQPFVFAAGGGSQGGGGAGGPGWGGGGGEFASDVCTVTPGNLYAYVVGSGSAGANGGNSTFGPDDNGKTITANGGQFGAPGTVGIGGSGSSNAIHFNGGNGGSVLPTNLGGGGGGGAGGSGGPGSNGQNGLASAGGSGGAGGGGILPGGQGGHGGANGLGGRNGTFSGWGVGGNGSGISTNHAGGNGFIQLQYAPTTSPPVIVTSMAPAAGTDPNTGDAFPGPGFGAFANGSTPAKLANWAVAFCKTDSWNFVNGTDGNVYDTGVQHITSYPNQTISAITFSNVNGAVATVGARHYRWHVKVWMTTSAAAGTPQFQFTAPATTGNQSFIALFSPVVNSGNALGRANNSGFTPGAGLTFNSAGQIFEADFDATFSASGTIQLQALTSNAADTFVVAVVYLDLYPVG